MYMNQKSVTYVECFMGSTHEYIADEPTSFSVDCTENVLAGWAALMAAWGSENKVEAIRHFRAHFEGVGLREAKAFVEDAIRNS